MDAEKLYTTLEKIQTAKGYFFNTDRERTLELLEALLKNKDRYGYMACPCRLASGDRKTTRTSSAPACTAHRMSKNTAAVTATSTFPRPGTTAPSIVISSPNGARRRRLFSRLLDAIAIRAAFAIDQSGVSTNGPTSIIVDKEGVMPSLTSRFQDINRRSPIRWRSIHRRFWTKLHT